MKSLGIGLIGTGYMGKAHMIAYAGVSATYDLSAALKFSMLADIDPQVAEQKAAAWSFAHHTTRWQDVVESEEVDIVDICSPNYLHKEMAMAAIAAGKHVYCEKPLALNSKDALEMTEAAEKAGVKTLVGFNYAKNPTVQLAKQMIAQGELGEIVHFRGTHNEDYLADASAPHSWRLERAKAGVGAFGDMGAHIVNMAQFLVGDITEIIADYSTVHKTRDGNGEAKVVENEDQAHMLVRFNNGAQGFLESSRIAWGRKNSLWFEITGTKGSIIYDQEKLSELQFYTADQASNRQGFKRILVGPEHPEYENFCISAGHGIGYNDQKVVEIRDLIEGIAANRPMWPQFRDAYEVNLILDAMDISMTERRWVAVKDVL